MDSVIKHVLNVGLGKINTNKKVNNLKPTIINGKTYRCNKDKPLTKTCFKKEKKKKKTKENTLSKIEKSNKYSATKILNQASGKNKVRTAVRKYAITQKATITDEQSAFKSYVNAYYISNIKMRGF